jgi:hypothetical protein
MQNEIGKRFKMALGLFWPKASWHRPSPAAKGCRPTHVRPTRSACLSRAPLARDGVAIGSSLVALGRWNQRREHEDAMGGGAEQHEGGGGSLRRQGDAEGQRRRWTMMFANVEWAPVASEVHGKILQYEADEGEVRGNIILPKCAWRRCSLKEGMMDSGALGGRCNTLCYENPN